MDGCPHNKDIIPIRLYLAGVDLCPSNDTNPKFKIKDGGQMMLGRQFEESYA